MQNAHMDTQNQRKVSYFQSVTLFALLASSFTAAANPVVAGRLWRAEPDGVIVESGVSYDIQEDLQMGSESLAGIWVEAFGFGFRYQEIEFQGVGGISVDTVLSTPILDIPLGSQDIEVTSRVDLDEYTLSWLPLEFGGLSLGGAVKQIDGYLDAEEQDSIGSYEVDTTFPLVALALQIPLIEEWGLTFVAEGQWISYEDDTVYEFELGWARRGAGLQLDMGYRRQRFDIVDGDDALDATIDGLFVNLGWQF